MTQEEEYCRKNLGKEIYFYSPVMGDLKGMIVGFYKKVAGLYC